jgi:hypothetical protein
MEEGKPENPEKTHRSKEENQQTQLTYDKGPHTPPMLDLAF